MKYRLEIKKQPTHDSDDFWLHGGKYTGHGYQNKETGKLHLEKCPKCDLENYAMQISEGTCYNCLFDPNTIRE